MKLIFFLSIYMAVGLGRIDPGPPSDKKKWYKCTKDSDCLVAAGVCGPEAVNKKYKKPFEEHAKKIQPYVDCMPVENKNPKAICYKNTCSLKPIN